MSTTTETKEHPIIMSAESVLLQWLEDFVADKARDVKPPPEYWINSYEPSFSYCKSCGEAKVKELGGEVKGYELDGGYCIESDFIPFCEECGQMLNACLTDYGAEELFDAMTEVGVQDDEMAWELQQVFLNWCPMGMPSRGVIEAYGDHEEKRRKLLQLAFRLLWDEINGERDAAAFL